MADLGVHALASDYANTYALLWLLCACCLGFQLQLQCMILHYIQHCLYISCACDNCLFPVQAMDPHAADCQTAMYCNRYPSVEGKHFPEGALRIGAHTDFELLTLLFTRPGASSTCLPL